MKLVVIGVNDDNNGSDGNDDNDIADGNDEDGGHGRS
jgi:hypothetical protein